MLCKLLYKEDVYAIKIMLDEELLQQLYRILKYYLHSIYNLHIYSI